MKMRSQQYEEVPPGLKLDLDPGLGVHPVSDHGLLHQAHPPPARQDPRVQGKVVHQHFPNYVGLHQSFRYLEPFLHYLDIQIPSYPNYCLNNLLPS